jgi:hypothetical protein
MKTYWESAVSKRPTCCPRTGVFLLVTGSTSGVSGGGVRCGWRHPFDVFKYVRSVGEEKGRALKASPGSAAKTGTAHLAKGALFPTITPSAASESRRDMWGS